MLLADLAGIVLRLAALAFSAIVAGLTGNYLHAVRGSSTWDQGRFIYTEVVAGISILLSILWLFPFAGSFIHWPIDLIVSTLWFVAFGLLVNWLDGSCGNVFDWSSIDINGTNTCSEWKANIAFCFLSAICWLASTLLGLYWVHHHRTTTRAPAVHRHRRWHRSRV